MVVIDTVASPPQVSHPRIIVLSDHRVAYEVPGIVSTEVATVSRVDVDEAILMSTERAVPTSLGLVIDCTEWHCACELFLRHPAIPFLMSDSNPAQDTLWTRLALAARVSKKGWVCVVVAKEETLPQLPTAIKELAKRPELRFRFHFCKKVEDGLKEAVSIVNAAQCLGVNSFSLVSNRYSDYNPYLLPPLIDLNDQWEAEEFEDPMVLGCVCLDNDIATRIIILRCLVLARLMSTRVYERRACDVTILLVSQPEYSNLRRNVIEETALYRFESNKSNKCWFHMANPVLLDRVVECSLSHKSVMVVDMASGALLAVHELRKGMDTGRSRHETLCSLTKDRSAFAVSSLPDGFVEVYRKGEMLMWYDRFRWRPRPFAAIMERLVTCMGDIDDVNSKIIAAFSKLMDQRESTIAAFLPATRVSDMEDDTATLPTLLPSVVSHIEHLRDGNDGSNEGSLLESNVGNISSEGIASILRLDGAHIFAGFHETSVHIVRRAQRVKVNQGLGVGTGRGAAFSLAGVIPRNGFVVLVSSGGELTIFPGRGRY